MATSLQKSGQRKGSKKEHGKSTPRIAFDKKDALYREASRIIASIERGGGSIKTLCYASPFPNKAALLGLVSETCRNVKVLKEVIAKSQLERERLSTHMLLVLLQDHLAGKLSCGPGVEAAILRHKTRLHAEWVRAKLKIGPTEAAERVKYARINSLKAQALQIEGAVADDVIPGLFRLPASFPLNHKCIQDGLVIVQDKASCMPPVILAPSPSDVVIDACAAPGNKTSLLCALMQNASTIYAFEKDPSRHRTLNAMLLKAGCKNVKTHCRDFLAVSPSDYPDVTLIQVDPSCSGSGMQLDLERSVSAPNDSLERLTKLSNFQLMILRHAMRFPSCRRVVYSTCSLYEIENEKVVERALAESPDWQAVRSVLPQWTRRGIPGYAFSQDVIRADPEKDRTHGFFVALLERKIQGRNADDAIGIKDGLERLYPGVAIARSKSRLFRVNVHGVMLAPRVDHFYILLGSLSKPSISTKSAHLPRSLLPTPMGGDVSVTRIPSLVQDLLAKAPSEMPHDRR